MAFPEAFFILNPQRKGHQIAGLKTEGIVLPLGLSRLELLQGLSYLKRNGVHAHPGMPNKVTL